MVLANVTDKDFVRRLALNRGILKNRYWVLPVDDKGHENYAPVGRGVKSSEFCGRWFSASVCNNVEGHKGVTLNGVDFTGKVAVTHNHMWCTKSSCPVCFARGWAGREARSIEGRLAEAVKRGLGVPEHITVSVPVADRDLPESVLRVKCRDALRDFGVTGGCTIFHGYRIDRKRNCLVWSPHYHSIGFVEGGFDCCRECVHSREDCASCDGLKGRGVRGFAETGYLVKVHAKRKTVFGTAHYQLNHATVRYGIRRFHVVTWFGSVSYRKFKSVKLSAEKVCPVCHEEMHRCAHVGKRHIVKDVADPDYVSLFADDEFDEAGEPNYIELSGHFG